MKELNETFFLNLVHANGAIIIRSQGMNDIDYILPSFSPQFYQSFSDPFLSILILIPILIHIPANCTIVDDDPVPTINISGTTIIEGNSSMNSSVVFEVTLSNPR